MTPILGGISDGRVVPVKLVRGSCSAVNNAASHTTKWAPASPFRSSETLDVTRTHAPHGMQIFPLVNTELDRVLDLPLNGASLCDIGSLVEEA
jgi:hypothetical protein